MPVIELRQRTAANRGGYVELSSSSSQQGGYDEGGDGAAAGAAKGFTSSTYPGGAGGGPPWSQQQQPQQQQRVPRGFGLSGDDDGSDDDFSSSGPLANDPWRRFRKTSRERLLRGFSPLRRTVAEAAHHPAAPKVYRFLCLFSLAGVVFLSSLARMLLSESPFFPARSKHGLSRREMGWAVVEAAAMYAFVMALSGYAWYRHTRRRAQLGGVMYTRLRDRAPEHPSLYNPRFNDPFY